MLNGDGNENGINIKLARAARFLFSNLQKLEFERVARFLVFLCHSFVRLQYRFVRLTSQTF